MIQQAIHHGLDVSIHRDTSNLMYRLSSLRVVARERERWNKKGEG
jgi:hypothetical protein